MYLDIAQPNHNDYGLITFKCSQWMCLGIKEVKCLTCLHLSCSPVSAHETSVHLDNGHYWSSRAAAYTGKPHRAVFEESLGRIYKNLYRNMSSTSWRDSSSLCIISITEGCTDTTRQALTTSFDIDIHNALVLLGMQAKVKGIMTVTWHIHWGAGFTLNGFMKN